MVGFELLEIMIVTSDHNPVRSIVHGVIAGCCLALWIWLGPGTDPGLGGDRPAPEHGKAAAASDEPHKSAIPRPRRPLPVSSTSPSPHPAALPSESLSDSLSGPLFSTTDVPLPVHSFIRCSNLQGRAPPTRS